MNRLLQGVSQFEPRGGALAAGRSLLGLAELTVLLFTPGRILFGTNPSMPASELCAGFGRISLWCATGGVHQDWPPGSWVAAIVLVGVVMGFRPRWLCIPHWYVAFSLATRTALVSGGEEVAQIVTLLLIPSCLGDDRAWHWQRPSRPLGLAWRGRSAAAQLILRLQVFLIYGEAAASKLFYVTWRRGVAVPDILLHDPEYGLPSTLRRVVGPLLQSAWAGPLLTWSAVGVELVVACSIFGRPSFRRRGSVLAVVLHAGIIVFMGLFSFGLTMIATAIIGGAGGSIRRPAHADRGAVTSVARGVVTA